MIQLLILSTKQLNGRIDKTYQYFEGLYKKHED